MDYSNDLCMGCMNKLNEDGNCGYCSYSADAPYIKIYLPPKTTLDDRYLVGKVLSYNGEGASYIGYDMMNDEKVVIHEYMPESLCTRNDGNTKVIVSSQSIDKYKTYMAEFAELNKILSRMRNLSNIVPATDMFAANNTMYAVSPYVEGISLKKFLKSGNKFTWAQVKRLFPPIFTTLGLIHNAGIIHGGISPENTLVTTKGEIKLVGFCITAARIADGDLTADLNPGYAAPEQYRGANWLGTYTDVYGMCAVLYKILTGVTPPSAIQRQNIDSISPLWQINPDVPRHVSDVIMQGLCIDYKERIQTITELVTRLFEQPTFVEHQKGSTQLLAKQGTEKAAARPDVQDYGDESDEEGAEGQKTNLTKTIITAVVLAVIVGIGLYLLASMFTPQSSGRESSRIIQTETIAQTAQPETQPATNDAATEPVTEPVTEVDYGQGAVMPDLVGLNYEEIKESIQNDFYVVTTDVTSDEYAEGVIVNQSIPADVEYNPTGGLTLDLEISVGSGKASLPDYEGVVSSDYFKMLDERKIIYHFEYEYSDSVQYGYITRVVSGEKTLDSGDNVNIFNNEEVTVYISSGSGQ